MLSKCGSAGVEGAFFFLLAHIADLGSHPQHFGRHREMRFEDCHFLSSVQLRFGMDRDVPASDAAADELGLLLASVRRCRSHRDCFEINPPGSRCTDVVALQSDAKVLREAVELSILARK